MKNEANTATHYCKRWGLDLSLRHLGVSVTPHLAHDRLAAGNVKFTDVGVCAVYTESPSWRSSDIAGERWLIGDATSGDDTKGDDAL